MNLPNRKRHCMPVFVDMSTKEEYMLSKMEAEQHEAYLREGGVADMMDVQQLFEMHHQHDPLNRFDVNMLEVQADHLRAMQEEKEAVAREKKALALIAGKKEGVDGGGGG